MVECILFVSRGTDRRDFGTCSHEKKIKKLNSKKKKLNKFKTKYLEVQTTSSLGHN